ncbi:hypothetical protein [Thalassospira xiamenensis]|uniref:hypothetical protein n=1 Tax=Thalassospira xiamenensis TaxID=220697 RepID=UPI003AA991E9
MKNSNLFFTALPTLFGVLVGMVSLFLGAWLYAAEIDKFTLVQYKTELLELNYWGAPGAFLWILGTIITVYSLLRKPSFTQEQIYDAKKGGSKPSPDPGGIPSDPFYKAQERKSEVNVLDKTNIFVTVKRTHAQMVYEAIANANLEHVVMFPIDNIEFVDDDEEKILRG